MDLQRLLHEHSAGSGRARLVVAGDSEGRASTVVEGARAIGCFEQIERASGASAVKDILSRSEFQKWTDSTTVVWDIGPDTASVDLKKNLRGIQEARWRGSWTGYVLASGEHPLAFDEIVECVATGFAGVGGVRECLDALRSWYQRGAGSVVPPNLALPFPKQPKGWLKDVYHDFLGNWIPGLRMNGFDPDTDPVLRRALREIDFWQMAVRAVLVWPRKPEMRRALIGTDGEGESYREVFGTRCVLLIPEALGREVHLEGWGEGEDHMAYGTVSQAARCLEDLRLAGVAAVVVGTPEALLPGGLRRRTAGFPLPGILVTRDECRLPWGHWKVLLADNILGAFTEEQYRITESGEALPVAKRDAWRCFGGVSLPGGFDRIIEGLLTFMVVTDPNFRENTIFGGNDMLRREVRGNLFRCIAQVWSAKGLYFPA